MNVKIRYLKKKTTTTNRKQNLKLKLKNNRIEKINKIKIKSKT